MTDTNSVEGNVPTTAGGPGLGAITAGPRGRGRGGEERKDARDAENLTSWGLWGARGRPRGVGPGSRPSRPLCPDALAFFRTKCRRTPGTSSNR